MKRAVFDFANENDVVAFRVAAAVVALKPGRHPFQNGLAGAREFVVHAFERVVGALGKTLCEVRLFRIEHVYDVMGVAAENRQAVGGVAKAPEHQGWLSDTELNELAVRPRKLPSASRVVMTVTPVANCDSAWRTAVFAA